MTPAPFTIILDDDQRDFLVRLLNGDHVDGDDESNRVALRSMLDALPAQTYPNTVEGVRAFLKDNASDELVPVTFRSDPDFSGCWEVTFANCLRALVYVADHPLAPDFEVGDCHARSQ